MPKVKGRLGHAAIRVDSDIGAKQRKIVDLLPAVEHLRNCLDSLPDYFERSRFLDDALDDVVSDIMDSSPESLVRLSHLFRATMQAPAENHELSMWNYKAWTRPEPVRVREIALTRGLVAKVDEDDYAALMEHNWSASLHMSPVAQRRIGVGRNYSWELMHNVIMNPPEGVRVEHVDGDKLNNTRGNLRLVQEASLEASG